MPFSIHPHNEAEPWQSSKKSRPEPGTPALSTPGAEATCDTPISKAVCGVPLSRAVCGVALGDEVWKAGGPDAPKALVTTFKAKLPPNASRDLPEPPAFPTSLRILCVHGIGHGDKDTTLVPSWTQAIQNELLRWNPNLATQLTFVMYDLHRQDNPNFFTYAAAVAKLLRSCAVTSAENTFATSRGIFDIPQQIRWTAGMVAQWANDDKLRKQLRDHLTDAINAAEPDIILAHSLGSLIAYDTLQQNLSLAKGKTFVTFGSQIGNPCVAEAFAGRVQAIESLTMWYHLFNEDDHMFTHTLPFNVPNFTQILTPFDKPNDPLNHDATWYLTNTNTEESLWRPIAQEDAAADIVSRAIKPLQQLQKLTLSAKPGERFAEREGITRRALLVGINEYANPDYTLQGCVNDVFLSPRSCEECGYRASDIPHPHRCACHDAEHQGSPGLAPCGCEAE